MRNRNDNYNDVIHRPHPTSQKHPRMSMLDRAVQFSPFAALTGHSDAVKETARLTDQRIELDKRKITELDGKPQVIADRLSEHPEVPITYFQPDERKSGGAYVSITGGVKKINEFKRTIVIMDKMVSQIKDIYEIEGDLFC